MNGVEIDFQLSEVHPDGRVSGRNCGAEARVGITFTTLARRVYAPACLFEDAVSSPECEFVAAVALRLETIEVAGRQLDFLSPGVTALLTLSGSGFAAIVELVARAAPRTGYSLITPTRPLTSSNV